MNSMFENNKDMRYKKHKQSSLIARKTNPSKQTKTLKQFFRSLCRDVLESALNVARNMNLMTLKAALVGVVSVAVITTSIFLTLPNLRAADKGPTVLASNQTIFPMSNETTSPSPNSSNPVDLLYPPSSQPSQDVSFEPSQDSSHDPTAIPTSSSTNKFWHIISMPTKMTSIAPSEINGPTALPSGIQTESTSPSTLDICQSENNCPDATNAPSSSSDNPSNKPSPTPSDSPSSEPSLAMGNSSFSPSASQNPSIVASSSPSDNLSVVPSSSPIGSPSSIPSSLPSDSPSVAPSPPPFHNPSITPSSLPSYSPSSQPSSNPSSVPSSKPSVSPSSQPSSDPSSVPSYSPTSMPTYTPVPTFLLEETILSDKLFGPSSAACDNYVSENGEYSFTFDLSTLPYFDDSLSDIEDVMFLVQMSHTNSNTNRTWSIKLGKGGNIYSFKGQYGESIPPNRASKFTDQVNQKRAVDTAKNNQALFSILQSGPFQDTDPGYTDEMPFWFSPNVAIYCSTTVPECRMASWGQQSVVTTWTERVIYYDRYRDCGDGILERTHIIHNAEKIDTNTLLTFTNMPWGGTRYSALKDFVFSQNPSWDYGQYNLQGGIEDPMLNFGMDASYGIDRKIPTTWTNGYTIFAQDLPFTTTPTFTFPGRSPADANQPTLNANYGTENSGWMCQALNGYINPDTGNYRCRFANLGVTMDKGCAQCHLRFTNSNGDSFAVFNVRHWLIYVPSLNCNLLYFNSEESITRITQVITHGATITVSWDDKGMRPEDNVGLSFVHGRSEGMVENNEYAASAMRFGYAEKVERDNAVLEYISYPNLAFGASFRARQYYITDRFTGLSDRSAILASDTIEEVISSTEFDSSAIHLHYLLGSNTFGSTIDDSPCRNAQTTAVACTGSSTPQTGQSAFLQIDCGASTYVGTDFYHFSNYPTVPYRAMNCTIDGVTTSNRPSVKLLGYFSDTDCGSVLQDKTYDASLCG